MARPRSVRLVRRPAPRTRQESHVSRIRSRSGRVMRECLPRPPAARGRTLAGDPRPVRPDCTHATSASLRILWYDSESCSVPCFQPGHRSARHARERSVPRIQAVAPGVARPGDDRLELPDPLLELLVVLLARLRDGPVHRVDGQRALAVAGDELPPVDGPVAAVQRQLPLAGALAARAGGLEVVVQVPEVHVALAVDGGEDRGVRRVPAHVVDVVLERVERQHRRLAVLHVPQLHAPVERAREREFERRVHSVLRRLVVLVRVHVDARDRALVAVVQLGGPDLGAVDVHLAHRPVLGSDVQRVGLVLREGEGHHREVAPVLRLVLEVDGLLRDVQHGQRPHAEPAVVRGGDQVRRVLRAHLLHRLDGVRVPLAAERRAQDGPRLGPGVPEHDAARVGAAVEERGVEAMEVGREHGARAGEGQLRPVLHRQVPDEHAAVGVRQRRVRALPVGREEDLLLVRREADVGDRPVARPLLLHVLVDVLHLVHAAGLAVHVAAGAGLEIHRQVPGLLAQRALHEQRRALEEGVEVWLHHDAFALLDAELLLLGLPLLGGLLDVAREPDLAHLPLPAVLHRLVRLHGAVLHPLGHLHEHGRGGPREPRLLLQLAQEPRVAAALVHLPRQVRLRRAVVDVGLLRVDRDRGEPELLLQVDALLLHRGEAGPVLRELPQRALGGGLALGAGPVAENLGDEAVDAPAQVVAPAAALGRAGPVARALLRALRAFPLQLLDLMALLGDDADLLLALSPQRLHFGLHAARSG
eukprot:CAMPEP_0179306092 /NCGR_PEP_ID=MMETSP0797-20121207/49954_1 /TAXON_ID=47934 /ORGANISM="Dinophysis acuminata, Strain DAEP01" /LENGTH=758 /DNA_ID=CAMNT_0021015747 /DNA_START=62 /DNA_END=2335 /DNA_ORIENTATION=-